ncbi:DoxX-like family protein [Dokdonella soli]|uniref:NAD(P)H-binding protein n=1 Tax=Dokdonella soli TaxID=529810 RepID=A0ABN1IEG5_9GAMM
MRVLVTGAYGFIGAQVVTALSAAGHEVVCAVRAGRRDERFPPMRALACDMSSDLHEEDWLSRLEGIDAVVNCAGILRERGRDTFEAVHVAAPLALFRAGARAGIRRVVQISALGDPADSEFVASKHRCDASLLALDLDAVVLRPSVVYSAAGSYGGTSLLRALAALPGVLLLPGSGEQRLQPIAVEDIGLVVAAVLARPGIARTTFEVVGPEVISLADYLRSWRQWLGYGRAREVRVPRWLVAAGATLGQALGRGPFGLTMLRMLDRGNVGTAGALHRLGNRLGVTTRTLSHALAAAPTQTQDRWHARLYFVLPALRISLALLWIASGLLGLLLPPHHVDAVTQAGPLPAATALMLARVCGAVDFILGTLCLVRWRPRLVLALMLVMLAGYTVMIGLLWPHNWLDPLGGLVKNLPLIAVLLALLATEERR